MQLTIEHVGKTYRKGKMALDDFNVQFTPGVYGILGPNGAGKSTLINIMTDNLKPDTGKVMFDDHDIRKMGKSYRHLLGYMPQQQGLYDEFTGLRFLWYMAALKGLTKKQAKEKIEELLHVVNLDHDAHKKLGAYSGGMKQRILIAQALLNDPQILIMDEPTAGLDPKERIRIRNFISTIAMNKIVIIATHVVSDIEFIAKRIVLIRQGRLVREDDPRAMLSDMDGKVFEARIAESDLSDIQERYKISNITGDAEGVYARIVGDEEPQEWSFQVVKPNLEDLYLYTFD